MAELPAYKPSGAGGYVDLKNIQVSHMISWGAFKHQFKSKYKAVAGTEWINGVEYFKPLDIRYSLRNSSSQTYEFMKFIGFSDDDLQKLVSDLDNKDAKVKTANMQYKVNEDFEQSDFDMYWDLYMEERFKFDEISVEMDNVSYEAGQLNEAPRSTRSFGINYSSPMWIIPNDDGMGSIDRPPELKKTYSAGYRDRRVIRILPNREIFNSSLITKAYKNGRDVSASIDREVLDWFGMMSVLEPVMMPIMRTNISKTYKDIQIDDGYGNIVTTRWVNVIQKEFIKVDNISYFDMKKKLAPYTDEFRQHSKCNDGQTNAKCDEKVLTETYTRMFWIAMNKHISGNIHEMTDGLFGVSTPIPPPILGLPGGSHNLGFNDGTIRTAGISLRYDGIDNCKPEVFGYFMSQFLYIHTTVDKGGWFKRFIGGLIKAILSFIGAVLDVFLKIPVLKQLTEIVLKIIGSIFGVDISSAKDILKQIILAVILIVIGAFIQPMISSMLPSMSAMTGTSALVATNVTAGLLPSMSTMITYSSQALSVFNAAMTGAKIGAAKEYALAQANRDYRMFQAQENAYKAKEASWGTMGSYDEHQQKDNMMYNIMFNPFDNHPQAVPADELSSGINMF